MSSNEKYHHRAKWRQIFPKNDPIKNYQKEANGNYYASSLPIQGPEENPINPHSLSSNCHLPLVGNETRDSMDFSVTTSIPIRKNINEHSSHINSQKEDHNGIRSYLLGPEEASLESSNSGAYNSSTSLPSSQLSTQSRSRESLTPQITQNNPRLHNLQQSQSHEELSTTNQSFLPDNSLRNAEKKFQRLIPFFADVNGHNFKDILIKVLRECSDQVPLDDFYNLLYNIESSNRLMRSSSTVIENGSSERCDPRLEGLHLCNLTLRKFGLPQVDDSSSTQSSINASLISVKYQDVCKIFLATKIIFDSVKLVQDTPSSPCRLSRMSIYKAYVIILKKLARKNSVSSESFEVSQHQTLNHSQIGKIIKSIFPKLGETRLGKRGDSKYYYLGITWNDLLIDDEIKNLLELSIPDLLSSHEKKPGKTNKKLKRKDEPSYGKVELTNTHDISSKKVKELRLLSKKPVYSFVHLSSSFPVAEAYPRMWQVIPGQMPQQSRWYKETIQRSIEVLRSHDIELDSLLSKISTSKFCVEALEKFFEDVLMEINSLIAKSASSELFLHLYLIVSTVIFPMAFSTGQESSIHEKAQLRQSLKQFVTQIECLVMAASQFNNLMAFSGMIKKMTNFNSLLSSRNKTSSIRSILKAMVDDSQLNGPASDFLLKHNVSRHAVTAFNAFNREFSTKTSEDNLSNNFGALQSMVKVYSKLAVAVLECVQQIPSSLTEKDWENETYDLSCHIFKTVIRVTHEEFFSSPFISQLPSKLIEHFLVSITNEFQNMSFSNFAQRDADLSQDIFKNWWIFSNSFQEYFGIVLEICAISALLS